MAVDLKSKNEMPLPLPHQVPPPFNEADDTASIRTQLPPYVSAPSYTAAPSTPRTVLSNHGVLGIYHMNRSDYFISAHAKDPARLFFAPAVRGMVKPHITLHPGSDDKLAPIAAAKFKEYGLDIDLAPNADYSLGPRGTVPVYEKGVMNTVRFFTIPVLSTHKPELFEWRKSSSATVKALEGKSNGWELVRVSTGTVVAVYAEVAMAISKIGKFRVLAGEGGEDLGEDLEKMVVMTLLAKAEEARRDAVSIYDASASGMTSAKAMPE